uniref:Ninein n=1 Tax=Leptobrachium leishanense TaxID=445787 RepID=A0A8C5N0I9_9ANUR
MEQDQYEARLKELFDSFDATGTGSLGQEELTDLCVTLQLEDVASSLQQALLQDNPHGRVHFDQFKEALIDELSSKLSDKDSFEEADCSPEVQPKYIKDGKKYGRRSVPELQDSLEEFDEDTVIEPEDEGTRSSQVSSRNCEELWKSQDGEEYEAEGQLRFWNPDDLGASQTNFSPSQDWMEEKLQLVCDDLGITRDGHLNRKKLISICEQYGFQNIDKETLEDAFQNLDQDDTMSFQDFFSKVCRNTKPLTPSVSTPYRHFKRHLSMQPYDESGRRTITPLTMTGCVGFSLFSKLDDGTGYGSVEDIIDLWQEDGVENGQAVIKALDFNVEGKINLSELTLTLENELLMTKNEVYQAALTSFRSEIRHLLESAEQVAREKDKLRSDLEKNERFKSLMASEVDDHHAAIERRNEYNLSKLDEEYKERTSALRSELRKEREQILQLSSRQRQELEQELDKVKTEENVLRDHLMLSLKESSRLETELLETSEKLIEYETLASKLQKSLDNVLREKFGDLDPSCIEFFRQEEKLAQMRNEYERQRRELQDRIDELQLELEEYRLQGVRGLRSPTKHSLSFEMDSKNVVECDQGIGSEECPPLNMSIEAEMAIEQMREQHQREVEHLTMELESKVRFALPDIPLLQNHLSQRDDERSRILKVRQAELEADIVKLKAEQQGALLKHKQDIVHIEADFDNQRVQLTERETSLRHQLDQTQRAFDEEKEELVMKASDLERDLENKLLEVITSLEMEKEELEQKHELAAKLVEEHQNELQEENMNMEYNRRILEIEDHFAKERESAARKHEEALRGLQEKFQSGLQELLDRHAEEKAKWQLEMGELLQERESTQRQLQEISGERSTACSALAEEKDVLENNFSERLSQLVAEKEDVQKALELLKVSSKKEKCELSRRILQLENDLKEELTERDEQLSKILQDELEELKQKHKTEKEELNVRLWKSEMLYKEACDLEKSRKADMLAEISTLQSTIHGLQKEIATSSQLHGGLKSLEQENVKLQATVSRLQSSSVLPEEERSALRNLQKAHEQTVKENVQLNADISRLQKKLDLQEHSLTMSSEANMPVDVLPVGKGNNVHGDPMNGNQLESLEDVNLRLFMKTEDHKCAAQMLKELEKCYKDTKTENGHLQAQVQLLQEDLSSLNVEYEHLKESTSFNFEYQEFGEAPITIVGLKMLLTVAKKENLHLLENLKLMELKNKEAVENNQELSSEVSWMQNEIQSMEEIAEASLKLENLYEEGKKENQELKMLILELQENIKELTGKPALKHTLDKEIQTTILENFELSGMTLPPNCESPCPSSPQTVPNRYIVEDCHPLYNAQRMETHQKKKTGCQEQALHTKPTVVKENIQKEEGTNKILKAEIHDETLVDEHVLKGRPQDPLDCPRCLICSLDLVIENFYHPIRSISKEGHLPPSCNKHADALLLLIYIVFGFFVQVSELKTKNLQLESQNADLSVKNTKNQTDIQELNQRLLTFRKQRGKKESKGLEEWQREKRRLKDEIEVYKSKVGPPALSEELSLLNPCHLSLVVLFSLVTYFLQLLKSSDLSNLKKEISALATKNEHLIKEKETLNEELNISVEKVRNARDTDTPLSWRHCVFLSSVKHQLFLFPISLQVQSLEDNLKSVNTQISRIRSDLRVAQQEKEALKQEVMSLHKQLQNANAKNQVLEMAVHSSGLQNNQKKLYWNDLEQLMEQEQKLLRQENERLQREVQNTKTDLHQSRDKVRQLESMALSLKHEKQQSHASMVRGLEQEKLSLRRECDQLQKELAAAHRKMSLLDREVETNKTESEGFRPNVGKFDEELIEVGFRRFLRICLMCHTICLCNF